MNHPHELVLVVINEVLEESGREPVQSVERATQLRSDLGLDSLDLAVLSVKIESRVGIDVFANGLVATVGEVLEQING
jgi:acyl carrier protein